MKSVKRENSHTTKHGSPAFVVPPAQYIHKAEKKLKADKLYRYSCGGFLDKGTEKAPKGVNVMYKAGFDRPVEEFIYPSLRPAKESRSRMDFSLATEDPKQSDLTWSVSISEVTAAEIPPSQTVIHKVEKGERYLRENIKSKYHTRVLAEAKKAEESMTLDEMVTGALRNRRENVLKSLGFLHPKPDTESPDDLYYDLLTNHKLRMQRAVAKYIGMKPLDRAHAELSTKIEAAKEQHDETDSSIHDGLLYYQIRNELSQKKRNDELAVLTAARVNPVKEEAPPRLARKMSSLQMRQMNYRVKRASSSFAESDMLDDGSDEESSGGRSPQHSINSMSEIKVSGTPMAHTPVKLTRLYRAVASSHNGYTYPEEENDVAPTGMDSYGHLSVSSLKDQTVQGKKRHAQDILMLREIKAGILPEQLLKKIPHMGNLISVDLSHFSLGDELGRCLGTSLSSLDMLHTLGLRGNRLTSKSITVILENVSNRSLRHLDLSVNNMRGGAVESLCIMLRNRNNRLSSLELTNAELCASDIKKLCESLMVHDTSWLLDWSLSHNHLSPKAVEYIATYLRYPGCSLNWFDLSWNSFDVKAGEKLAAALSVNKTLSSINLAANALRDEGGQHIAACLLGNQTLREIFLSLNNIGGKTCFIFSKVLRVHPCMERLDLNDNPLSEAGARSIFRTILKGLRCFVMMQNCTFNAAEGLFNHSNPSLDSPYSLNLAQPYQVAILSELINMANENSSCSFTSLSYKQSEKEKEITITAHHKDGETYLRSGMIPWAIPNSGILKVEFAHQVNIPTESMAIDDLAFNTILAIVINARSENDRKNWLMLMCMDAYFTTLQAQDLIDILEDRRLIGAGGISKVDLFVSFWGNLIDTVHMYDFLYENLDNEEKMNLIHALTIEKFKFNWINPTGHWRLDMNNRVQRRVMMQLVAHNGVESKFSATKSRRNDTSQKGNWHNFRNERYNGEEIIIDVDYTKNIPWTGLIEFDYVSTTRPATPAPETITDDEFDIFLRKLELSTRRRLPRTKGNIKLLELQLAVTQFYFTTADVLSILDCFSDDDSTQARIVVCLHNRIDDLYNFDIVLRHLSSVAVQDVFCKLGVLNCLNPLKPAQDYKFAMKYYDNRLMTHTLLQMSSLENGDMLKQHPRSEVDIIALYASLGRLLTDQTDAWLIFSYCEIGERQSVPAWNFRKDMLKMFLIGSQPVDTRAFKIISMYKEIDAAGMLLVGPIDLQYREFVKAKNSKHKKTLKNALSLKAAMRPSTVDDDSKTTSGPVSAESSLSTVPSLPDISMPNTRRKSSNISPDGSARRLEDQADVSDLLADDYGRRKANI